MPIACCSGRRTRQSVLSSLVAVVFVHHLTCHHIQILPPLRPRFQLRLPPTSSTRLAPQLDLLPFSAFNPAPASPPPCHSRCSTLVCRVVVAMILLRCLRRLRRSPSGPAVRNDCGLMYGVGARHGQCNAALGAGGLAALLSRLNASMLLNTLMTWSAELVSPPTCSPPCRRPGRRWRPSLAGS